MLHLNVPGFCVKLLNRPVVLECLCKINPQRPTDRIINWWHISDMTNSPTVPLFSSNIQTCRTDTRKWHLRLCIF